MNKEKLIEFKSINVSIKKIEVLSEFSLTARPGEITGLLGRNGAGKTTSFYTIVGLIPPDKGKIFLSETELTDLPMYKRSQLGVGYLPQEASIFRKLTVEENIIAVLEMQKKSKQEIKNRTEEDHTYLSDPAPAPERATILSLAAGMGNVYSAAIFTMGS